MASAAAAPTCSFHLVLRSAKTRSGSSRSAAAFLRYSCSVGTLGSSGKLSRSTTGTLPALSRSATLAASRPPTMTAVVPNSSARSSARWISSRVLLSHQTGIFLVRAAKSAFKAGSNGGRRPPIGFIIGVELLEVVGVEHGLAEVGDRAHQDAGIGVFAGSFLTEASPPASPGRGRESGREPLVSPVQPPVAGSEGGAR